MIIVVWCRCVGALALVGSALPHDIIKQPNGGRTCVQIDRARTGCMQHASSPLRLDLTRSRRAATGAVDRLLMV